MNVALELKAFRRRYNLTQWQAAQWCYLKLGTIHDYEQGRTEPNRITLEGIRARIALFELERVRLLRSQVAVRHDFYDLALEPDGSIIFRGVIPTRGSL
jgi:DNA-binding XRE family transcriptional regulator